MRFYTYTVQVHATWYNALQDAIVHLHVTLHYRKDRRQDSVKLIKKSTQDKNVEYTLQIDTYG